MLLIFVFDQVVSSFGYQQDNERYYRGFASIAQADFSLFNLYEVYKNLLVSTRSFNNGFSFIYINAIFYKVLGLEGDYQQFALINYILNIFYELFISYLIYSLCKTYFNQRVGIIATALFLCYAERFVFSLVPLKETFSTFALFPVLYLIIVNRKKQKKTMKNILLQIVLLVSNVFNRVASYLLFPVILILTKNIINKRRYKSIIKFSFISAVVIIFVILLAPFNVSEAIYDSVGYWVIYVTNNEEVLMKNLTLLPYNLLRFGISPYPFSILNDNHNNTLLWLMIFPTAIKYGIILFYISTLYFRYFTHKILPGAINLFVDFTVISLLIILSLVPGDYRFIQVLFPFVTIISAFMITTAKNGPIIFILTILSSCIYYMKIFGILDLLSYFIRQVVPLI